MDHDPKATARTSRSQWTAGLLGLVALALAACAANLVLPERAPQSWWDERGPVVPHDTFPSDCSLCHVGPGWRTIRDDFEFDHAAETGVALEGAHASAECLRCHNDRGPVQAFASKGCAGCHVDPHVGRLGPSCSDCHDQLDWRPSGVLADHQATRFPLVGAHLATACALCHPGADAGRFTGVSTECASCHLDDALAAQSFDHSASGNLTACDQCHQPTGWSGGAFVHAFFPLSGGHALSDCTACHSSGTFTGLSTDCFSCHAGDYAATSDPPHAAAGFPTSCQSCHTINSWDGANFNHLAFPITSGDHVGFDCSDCHTTPSFPTFSCTHCHAHSFREMEDKHDDVSGFAWSSPSCYACHPDGKE